MSLQALLTDYKKHEEIAGRDPNEFSVYTRPGIEMQIRASKDSLGDLAKRYGKAFLENAVGIFLDGPAAAELATHASKTAVTVDAATLYIDIAKDVEPTLGSSRQFNSTQAMRALAELSRVASSLSIASMNMVKFATPVETRSFEDVVTIIRNGLRASLGDDLNRIYLERLITTKALDMRFVGTTAPVFITDALAAEVEGLSSIFGKGSALRTVTADDVSDEGIAKILKEVGKQIKRK